MNYPAHIDSDFVAEEYPDVAEIAPSLDSFVSEATIVQAPFKTGDYRHPLWEFPQEEVVAPASSGSSNTRVQRSRRIAVPYTSLAVTIVIAIMAGFWWEFTPRSRTIGSVAETAKPVVNAPVAEASRDTPHIPPAELMSSIEVHPSVRPPVATIVPAIPPPVLLLATEQRRPADRAASMAPAADAKQPARSTPVPAIRTREVAEPTPTESLAAMNLPARPPVPVPDTPVASVAPPALSPPPPTTSASAIRPEPAALPSVVARTEQSEIQGTLAQYRAAYDLLDARAAQAVWPSVDVRALSRAFDTLASQQLAFETCELEIAGRFATAECRGSATYAPKVGDRDPRLERRQWTFRLQKQGDAWKIQSAQTRR